MKKEFINSLLEEIKKTAYKIGIGVSLFLGIDQYGPAQFQLQRPAHEPYTCAANEPSKDKPLNVVYITDSEFKKTLEDGSNRDKISHKKLENLLNSQLINGDDSQRVYPQRQISFDADNISIHKINNADDILKIIKSYNSNSVELVYILTHGSPFAIGPNGTNSNKLKVSKLLNAGAAYDFSKTLSKDGKVILLSCSANEGEKSNLTFAETLSWLVQRPVIASKTDVILVSANEKVKDRDIAGDPYLASHQYVTLDKVGDESRIFSSSIYGDFSTVYPKSDKEIAKESRKGWLERKLVECLVSP